MATVTITWTRTTEYVWEGDWDELPALYRDGLTEPAEDDETGWEKALEAVYERLDRRYAAGVEANAWQVIEDGSDAADENVTIDSVE